jgi:hypothetical protein
VCHNAGATGGFGLLRNGVSEMTKEFYDLCFENWMRGRSPDDVSIDDYDSMLYKGFSPDEIHLRNVTPCYEDQRETDGSND